jgi:hypothetical protein
MERGNLEGSGTIEGTETQLGPGAMASGNLEIMAIGAVWIVRRTNDCREVRITTRAFLRGPLALQLPQSVQPAMLLR